MSVHVCLQHKHGRDLVYKFFLSSRHVGLEEHAFGLHGGQSLINPVDGKAFWQIGLESGDEFLDLLRLEAEGVVHIFGKADHELHGFLVAQKSSPDTGNLLLFSPVRVYVSTGCAVIPKRSLAAMPMRRSPTSKHTRRPVISALIQIVDQHFFDVLISVKLLDQCAGIVVAGDVGWVSG